MSTKSDTYEVEMTRIGHNGKSSPEHEEDHTAPSAVRVTVDRDGYPDDFEATEEAISEAVKEYTKEFNAESGRKGWQYIVRSGRMRSRNPETGEWSPWTHPSPELAYKEEFEGRSDW